MAVDPNVKLMLDAMAALVVVCLIAWVLADHDAQRRQLSDLEARGVTRRSKEVA